MKKIEANESVTQSAAILTNNLSQLQELFPEVFAEGKVRFDILRQLLGEAVDEGDEKYGLNWHGKRRARQIALTPSTGTLLPCPDESIDWATTQNLMIEGDNLEVLKLLQKSYAGKVKLIYIDPPYNTGKDFVYPDNFQDGIGNYLELTGQIEGGVKLTANTESSGRFHTDWLNMIYPRLRLAKSLLTKDGAIFISIDDHELENLRIVCNEIFGEENFVGTFVWRRRASSSLADRLVSTDHEYVVVYQHTDFCSMGIPKDFDGYKNPDKDPRGPWVAGDLTVGMNKDLRPNQFYDLIDPITGVSFPANPNRVWAYIPESMNRLLEEKRVLFPSDTTRRPMLKRFKSELKSDVNPVSTWLTEVGLNTESTKELQDMFGQSPFDYAKPTSLIKYIIKTSVGDNELILDFFAGSGTTGQAALEVNAEGGSRRYILVQLPEPVNQDFLTIAEITKERLRRAGKKIKDENPMFSGDTGFRVFKLDKSNIREWSPDTENIAESLLDHHEHILEGRTEADIVYELLLKLGLDLCVPIESRAVAGKTIEAVGGGVLMLCLSEKILTKEVEAIAAGIVAWHKELAPAGDSTVVFRDSAFADDVAKTNMAAILSQNGLENVRSL